jgi:pyruvate/2-oxoglutarate dehydrogenase complex dihydrolipoamide acyltransferase (E2) component
MPLQPTPITPTHPMLSHMQQMHVTQAQANAQIQAHANAQAHAQAQAQAQAWAAARQHMNQSRNQNFSPHQLSPHVQHVSRMNSASSSRRQSAQLMDPHAMNPNAVNMGLATGMEGLENHQDQFLRMDMGLGTASFVGSNDGMGS